jgi:hypothetical protein
MVAGWQDKMKGSIERRQIQQTFGQLEIVPPVALSSSLVSALLFLACLVSADCCEIMFISLGCGARYFALRRLTALVLLHWLP